MISCNRIRQALFALLLAVGLCAVFPLQAGAAESTYSTSLEITYVSSDQEISTSGTELFDLEGLTMPGDSVSATVVFHNRANTACGVWLQSQEGSSTVREHTPALMDQITLAVADAAGTRVYDGTLSAQELQGSVLLAHVDPGNSYTLSFTAAIPAELDNRYSLAKATVPWVLTVAEDVIVQHTGTPVTTAKSSGPYDQTGGGIFAMVVLACVGMTVGAVVVVGALRRLKKEDPDD
ncbi:MAG: hypothetical protein Q4E12_01360 [Coriobacteriia bacterium]|nr:hypothetical protein [Coriobacteriia bacterium]